MSTSNPTSKQFAADFPKVSAGDVPKYVALIQDGRISISEPGTEPIAFANEAELVAVISDLIDKGYAFGDEPAGWPPAAILKSLQERWLLERDFTAIIWLKPGVFRTYVVPHMTDTRTCPQCSATAKYSTLGHLYSLKCEACGHEEEGTFLPAMEFGVPDNGPKPPLKVSIRTNGLAPVATNLRAFAGLHASFAALTPIELKKLYVSEGEIALTFERAFEAYRVRDAGVAAGFDVAVSEIS